jgi:putative transposase
VPWKESSPIEQRLAFVVAWTKHETSMAELCRSFGISRKTGYRLVELFHSKGIDGLKRHSRAPQHHPNAIAEGMVAAVIRAKAAHPSWGPKKLQPLVDEELDIQQQWPVASTRGAILARAGLTVPRRRTRGHVPPRTQPFAAVVGPNETWCADYKGWFRTADGMLCEPLTISDAHSRMLLRCRAVAQGVSGTYARVVRSDLSRIRIAAARAHRQRRSICRDGRRWTLQAGDLVDQTGHHAGTHRSWPAVTERPS